MPVVIRPVRLPLPELAPLLEEAAREGASFVARLAAEWENGVNRFDRPGETLLGAFVGEALVGIGGLNRDPFCAESGTGRLRHLYVLKAWRGRGFGSALVESLLAGSERHFSRIRLRTRDAGPFYLRHGFEPSAEQNATHVRQVEPTAGG